MQQVERLRQANQVGLPLEGELGDGCHGDSFIMTASERGDELLFLDKRFFNHIVTQFANAW